MPDDERLSIDSLHLSFDEEEEHEPRKTFLLLFFKLFHSASLYDLKNEALEKPLADVCSAIQGLIEMEGKITVEIGDGYFLFNRRKIVLDLDKSNFGEKISLFFDQKGIGGFIIPEGINRVQLTSFLQMTVKSNDPLPTTQEKLKRGKIPLILIPQENATDQVQGETSFHISERLLRTYFHLLILFHDYVSNLKDLGEKIFLTRRMKRTTQQLIEQVVANEQVALGLQTIRNCEEYGANRAVNTVLLSILMGKKLGFKRRALSELALAALFHDIGQYHLADSTLRKEGSFTSADWEEMEKQCVLGVRDFMQLKSFNTTLIRRIIVTYEHHKN